MLWDVGLCTDAGLRIYMAWQLPVDAVPGLTTALTTATAITLIAVANIHYQVSGAARAWSPFHPGMPWAVENYPKARWAKSRGQQRKA